MKIILTVLFFFSFCQAVFCQQIKTVRDLGFWGGVNIEKSLSKQFEINLEQQVRIYNNLTEFDDYLIEVGGKYTISKKFKLGANLRYTRDAKRWKETENEYRYNLDLFYSTKLASKFKLSYRLRYQQAFVKQFPAFNPGFERTANLRNKVKIAYKLSNRNTLYFSAELFRRMEAFRDPYFNQIRFYLGNQFKTKIGQFNGALGYEQEINTDYPLSFFFVKIIYKLKL